MKIFPDSTHVAYENLIKVTDREIWVFAKKKEYCILTKDWDYKFLSITLGCPPKVIHINCGNTSTNFIAKLLKDKMQIVEEFISYPENCYLEIT